VAALVATGRGDSLEEVEPDRSPLGELPAGEIEPEQLRSLRFSIAFRGYRMDQVDAVIERMAVEIEQGKLAARTPDRSHRPAEPEDD
jgi:DivIVA domain-containing protein